MTVRRFAVLGLMLAWVSSVVRADEPPVLKEGQGIEAPAEGFAKLSAMFGWAAKSSFGGGSVSTYHLGDRDVHVVSRSFTSGRASVELSFYVQRTPGAPLTRALYLPMRPVELRTRLDEQTLVVEQYRFQTGKWVTAMTLTADCFDP